MSKTSQSKNQENKQFYNENWCYVGTLRMKNFNNKSYRELGIKLQRTRKNRVHICAWCGELRYTFYVVESYISNIKLHMNSLTLHT